MKIICWLPLLVLSARGAIAAVQSACPCFEGVDIFELKSSVGLFGNEVDGFTGLSGSTLEGERYSFDVACADATAQELKGCQEQLQSLFDSLVDSVPYPEEGIAETCPCSYLPGALRDNFHFSLSTGEDQYDLYFEMYLDYGQEIRNWLSPYEQCGTEQKVIDDPDRPYVVEWGGSMEHLETKAHVNRCYQELANLLTRHLDNPPTASPSIAPTPAPSALKPCSCLDDAELDSFEEKLVVGKNGYLTGLNVKTPNGWIRYTTNCIAANKEKPGICPEQVESLYADFLSILPFPDAGVAYYCPCPMQESVTRFSLSDQYVSLSSSASKTTTVKGTYMRNL